MAKTKKFKWKRTHTHPTAASEYSIETLRHDRSWSSSWFIRRYKKHKYWCFQLGDQTMDRYNSLEEAKKAAKLVFEVLNHKPFDKEL